MSKSVAHSVARLTRLTAALAVLAAIVPAVAGAVTGPYVSLGDSYTSAPLVPQIPPWVADR